MSRRSENQISIANVAAMAGVSTATVSRVLSGHRRKDDEISKRVREAADKLNYSANFAASVLRSEKTRTLGLIISGTDDGFSGAFLDLLSRRLSEQNRYLVVVSDTDKETREEAIRYLAARQVEGIILIPSIDDDTTGISDNLKTDLPMVQVGGQPLSYHINWVGMDQAATMRLVITHLAEQNAHAVAFLSRPLNTSSSTELFSTFYTLTNTLRMTPEPDWVQFGECTMSRGYDATMTMLTRGRNHPDAIICADDSLALGALMACQELGIQIPDQVQVAGFIDSPACQICKPTLTSVTIPIEGMVQETLHLIDTDHGQTLLPAHVALPPELKCRESTWSPRTGSSDMTSPGTVTY